MSFENPKSPTDEKASEKKHSDVEAYVTKQLEQGVSEERKAELNRELNTVLEFFDKEGIGAYVAGGTGIDLLDGEWDRDHQDLDVAIMGSDRERFYTAATQAGFLVTDPDRNAIRAEEITRPETHNAFLFRSNEEGTTQFEVLFLNETTTGDVELTSTVAASRKSFESAPKIAIAGREVVLQPPAFILFHKLNDGRRKDLRDAERIWSQLQPEQRSALEDYLRNAQVRFVIDDEEIVDVPTLLSKAKRKDAELHAHFFGEKIDILDTKLTEELMAKCEELFEIRQGAINRSVFFETISEKYQGFIPERKTLMEAIADVLYEEPAPNLEEFKVWARRHVGMDERIKQQALHDYVSEKVWETKTG